MTETFAYDGGRAVTVYVPAVEPTALVLAGDGPMIARWGSRLEEPDVRSVMIVAAHRAADETTRLHEYSPGFDEDRFTAHERFLIGDVRTWIRSRFGAQPPTARTAAFGVSAGGELALALGLRHPDVFGAVLCASPGGGYQPPTRLGEVLPRVYLTAGTREPFFRENAARWARALTRAGGEVEATERNGTHGGAFWRDELPLMVRWAFGAMTVDH